MCVNRLALRMQMTQVWKILTAVAVNGILGELNNLDVKLVQ